MGYGFFAVPRKYSGTPNSPKAYTAKELSERIPQSDSAQKINAYAKKELPEPMYNHCMRVFLYCQAILKDQFSNWDLSADALYSTCLLHDVGQTDKNMKATKISFEFWGGMVARNLVLQHTDDQDYADAVFEAIARHQDLGDTGSITALGHILQLGTILDNVGLHAELIHGDTIESINKAYPRHKWLACFEDAVNRENKEKPWGHTSKLGKDDFPNSIRNNKLMAKYE